jgi:hypothetical protein
VLDLIDIEAHAARWYIDRSNSFALAEHAVKRSIAVSRTVKDGVSRYRAEPLMRTLPRVISVGFQSADCQIGVRMLTDRSRLAGRLLLPDR